MFSNKNKLVTRKIRFTILLIDKIKSIKYIIGIVEIVIDICSITLYIHVNVNK